MADDQGAIPTEAVQGTSTFGGDTSASGGAISNGAATFGGTPNSFAPAAPNAGQATFGGASTQGGDQESQTQQLKAYFSGQNSMPKNQYDQARQQAAAKDPNDVTAEVIAKYGEPALQATRQHWDVYRGAAMKAIADGNNDLAASEATKAFQYAPEGTRAMVSPGKDGFIATVHLPDGSVQNNTLSPQELNSVFSGANGLFDHIIGKGVPSVIDAVKNSGGAFGGPPGAAAPTPPPTGTPQQPVGGGIPGPQQAPASSFPGNQAPRPSPPGQRGIAPQNTGAPGVATGEPNPAVPGIQRRGGGEGLPAGQQRTGEAGGVRGEDEEGLYHPLTITRGGQSTTQMVGRGPKGGTRIGNSIFPEGTPPDVIARARAGQNATALPGISPGAQTNVQEQYPGDRANQARAYANMQGAQQQQTGAERIAQIRGPEVANIRAAAANQVAVTKAQAIINGTDTRFVGEQNRNATNIFIQRMKGDPSMPLGDQIKILRENGAPADLIAHITNPESPAPRQPQQTQQTQQAAPADAPQNPAQRIAGTTYNTPKGPLKWTGTGWLSQ